MFALAVIGKKVNRDTIYYLRSAVVKPMALAMQGKHSSTELHPQTPYNTF